MLEQQIAVLMDQLPAELMLGHGDVAARLGFERMQWLERLRGIITRGVVVSSVELERALVGSASDPDDGIAIGIGMLHRGGAVQLESVEAALSELEPRQRWWSGDLHGAPPVVVLGRARLRALQRVPQWISTRLTPSS